MANLLLIDDDAVVVPEQIPRTFPSPEHRVEVAGTGAEGLDRVATASPDAILLDLRLPEQAGLEIYRRMRACSWPANMCELLSVVKQELLVASGPVLVPALLPDRSGDSRSRAATSPDTASLG